MAKTHIHEDQFDGELHPRCSRGSIVVDSETFAAMDPGARCTFCARDEFPHGQPEWHRQAARDRLKRLEQEQPHDSE